MKKLSETEKNILALAVVQPGYRLDTQTMPTFIAVAALTLAGYLEADTGCVHPLMLATNKGVRSAVRMGIVRQHGTKFYLPDGSTLEMQLPMTAPAPVTSPAVLRVVPPKPRDPFDEGFTAAVEGVASSNTWTDLTQAAEYDEGYRQGAAFRAQNPQTA